MNKKKFIAVIGGEKPLKEPSDLPPVNGLEINISYNNIEDVNDSLTQEDENEQP